MAALRALTMTPGPLGFSKALPALDTLDFYRTRGHSGSDYDVIRRQKYTLFDK